MMARTALLPLLCGGAILLLFQFVLFLGYVPSTSMEPTIMAATDCTANCGEGTLLFLKERVHIW